VSYSGTRAAGRWDQRTRLSCGGRYSASANAERRLAGRSRGALSVDLLRERTETGDGRREEEGNLERTDMLLSAWGRATC